MPQATLKQVTITLTDTPEGGVSHHSNFKPAVGEPLSPAQAYALEILNRTNKDWGVKHTAAPKPVPVLREVDIDAVHHTRDRVVGAA